MDPSHGSLDLVSLDSSALSGQSPRIGRFSSLWMLRNRAIENRQQAKSQPCDRLVNCRLQFRQKVIPLVPVFGGCNSRTERANVIIEPTRRIRHQNKLVPRPN
jgi:hypothetical protein